jgi:hypothetical protein
MENLENIAKAIVAVMQVVKGVEKNTNVGTGSNSYKGVADKDVKIAIGEAMEKHGLSILPIGVEAKTTTDRWEETNQYGTKTKQSVFTEVETKYLLLHTSGESIVIAGYGHGVDSQDKAAGKATTYALKNALLYAFMVPTGTIDDTDNEHSENKEVPPMQQRPTKLIMPLETPQQARPAQQQSQGATNNDDKPWLTEGQLKTAIDRISKGDSNAFNQTIAAFKMKKEYRERLNQAYNSGKQ